LEVTKISRKLHDSCIYRLHNMFASMRTRLNFTALITETKGKLTTPSVANRVDAFVTRSLSTLRFNW
ncbi:hypothetical protein, partial [Aliivibrio fischeri]|uniref:hypothetical protein n=1 Tax=Aliivibrio fischeri TaxID=668 RepID=UPI001BE3FBDA